MCACSVVYVFALSAELGVLRKEVRFGLAGGAQHHHDNGEG